MQTQWSEWLAAEFAAGRGGVVLAQAPITRGQAWRLALAIPGDQTGATFAATLHVGPNSAPIAGVTISASLAAFDAVAGTTTLTLALDATETDTELPADSDFDGVEEVVLKLDYTAPGGSPARAMGLVIPVVE